MAVNLIKGQKISLKKDDGSNLVNFCVGANWGAISEKGFFRDKVVPVDLDLSLALFDTNKRLCDIVYFGKKSAPGIFHSGDDLTGDVDGDDGLDNEVISIDLNRVETKVEQIFFVLNSYNQVEFNKIPFASIRLYEGTPTRVSKVFATYNVANDHTFAYKVSMILGKLYKRNNEWKFSAIGEPTSDRKLEDLITISVMKFL
ncbi:TerD family protein [Campylobacter geochelonis]|uniref:Stress response protein SCP2 n=1 Tax=Campylobacter geochelonis TaxID=1780362 RepID=A0A128EMU6_9BACT|nr:TerD family protein [Campylobacter geochelonis]QKF72014.1 TerD family protein [Campylobacter geochelonis]CZE45722.1 Stress response protein SCP2 [Campylobacter geochelonis]CZE46906.1 Stress response protein SCP2 [Campylobacter geochelonis]CZE49900.1 Stress response protein SCP2 [Campylobacter geochelonis]